MRNIKPGISYFALSINLRSSSDLNIGDERVAKFDAAERKLKNRLSRKASL